jgi:hypothetical protein
LASFLQRPEPTTSVLALGATRRGFGAALLLSLQRCIHLTTELALTQNARRLHAGMRLLQPSR